MLITGSDSSQPTTLSMFSSLAATGTRFGKLRRKPRRNRTTGNPGAKRHSVTAGPSTPVVRYGRFEIERHSYVAARRRK